MHLQCFKRTVSEGQNQSRKVGVLYIWTNYIHNGHVGGSRHAGLRWIRARCVHHCVHPSHRGVAPNVAAAQ